MGGPSIRLMNHSQFEGATSKIEDALHTLDDFKNDSEEFDKEI
jgi:hypothetical protein